MEVLLFHSAYGNNQFTQLPFKIRKTSFCDTMKNSYKTYLMNELKSVSDLPYSNDEDLCKLLAIVIIYTRFNLYYFKF